MHGRQTHHLRILLRYRNWCRPSQEIEIQDSSKSVVLQVLMPAIRVVDLDIHAVGVQEKNTVSTRNPVLKVHRVVPVEIGSIGNAIIGVAEVVEEIVEVEEV